MPAYSFEALDTQGQTRRGVLEADTARTARSQLRAQDLVPLKVEPVQRTGSGLNTVIWESKVFSSTALAVWTRQLSGLVNAGLPLERALSALADEAETPRQRDLVSTLRAEVNAGAPFAKALGQHPREFSAIFTAVIGAGEQSGHLGLVLERLADDLQEQQNLRGKLLAAGLYPAIVCVVALVIVLFLLAYVVPQVAQVFGSNQQQQLPALTSFMLALSSFVQNFWLWGLMLVALLSAGGHGALKQADVRLRFDAMWLQLPLIGRLARGYNAARFASTLAMLATAGVPILKALQAAADTLSNTALKRDAQDALVLVREGAPLASALAQHPRFPRLLVMFSRLGEQTGTLPTMLQRAAAQLSEEVQRRALQLATILEPLLIVAMGAMVMLIVLAVMLPIIQLNQWVR